MKHKLGLVYSYLMYNPMIGTNPIGELMNEENTLNRYRVAYHRQDNRKLVKPYLKDLATWTQYAHENYLYYEVSVLDEAGQIHADIVFNDDLCNVYFYDEYNRTYMLYHFKGEDTVGQITGREGMLFLTHVEISTYPEGKPSLRKFYESDSEEEMKIIRNNETHIEHRYFSTEGYLEIKRYSRLSEDEWHLEVEVADHPVNVEKNWEPRPPYGDYAGVLVLERWQEDDFLKEMDMDKATPPKPDYIP